MGDSELDYWVRVECFAATGHGPPWPDSLVRSLRVSVRKRLADCGILDPDLSKLH